MNNKIAMIPARLGSKRIKKKNLRLLNGKPMISYIIEAAKASGCFDEIYLNSEAEVFREIADNHGIKFYKRPEEHSTDSSTNDDFALDFINNIECGTLFQLLPTSPFITAEVIRDFVNTMESNSFKSMVSVRNAQISCLYKGRPINFEPDKPLPPSQEQEPIKIYATALMAWNTEDFILNIEKFGAAYHGVSDVGYFVLDGYSTVDVDNEEDFILAEVVAESLEKSAREPQYYGEIDHRENDVPSVLVRDGVAVNDLFDCNNEIVSIAKIMREMGSGSWSKRVINTESNSATLISQNPGEGNRRHYHDSWNEWWYIVDGTWKWEIEGQELFVKKGEIVFIEKNKWHQITAVGDKPAIRLAVSREDVDHIYA